MLRSFHLHFALAHLAERTQVATFDLESVKLLATEFVLHQLLHLASH